MDRPTTRKDADAIGRGTDPIEAFALPSRRAALELCRGALLGLGAGPGPVLLTGDAGVGKTWAWRRLRAESPPSRRWACVDVTPSDAPADFYRLIAQGLRWIEPAHPNVTRVELVDHLVDRFADGDRPILVVEEAHNLSTALWEEVRVLANRLGRPGGFSGMMLVGQTPLARRLSTRPFASIEARLAAKVHLGPIEVDEAGELLARHRPGRAWSTDEIEALHRDCAGNPGRLLRCLGPTVEAVALETRSHQPEPARLAAPAETKPRPATIAAPAPLTGPDRPPIRVEENMIEVGWSPEEAAPTSEADDESPRPIPSGEEAVRDHYAALQAWREWTENQARRSPTPLDLVDELEPADDEDVDPETEARLAESADRPRLRAEGEQKFAPFGQLFSKMAQALEPE